MRFALLLLAGCATLTPKELASRELDLCVRRQIFAETYGNSVSVDCRNERAKYCWAILKEMGCIEGFDEWRWWRMLRQRPPNPGGIGP